MRVVVIDSRMRIRHELVGMLVEMRHEAVGCADPNAALPTLRESGQRSIAIVGDVDGYETSIGFCRSLRAHPEAAAYPILILTTADSEIGMSDLINAGASDTIQFPVTEARLQSALDTVRREAERTADPIEVRKRLRKPAELLMDVFDQAPDSYFLADTEGRILASNHTLRKLTGYGGEELSATTLYALGLAYDDSGDGESAAGPSLETKSGEHLPVTLQTFDVRIARTTCTLGVVRGVSDADTPQSSENVDSIIAAISENVSDVIWLLTPTGKVRFVSPSVTRPLGFQSSELVGLPLEDFIHPDDHDATLSLITGQNDDANRADAGSIRIRHSDGSWVQATVSASDLSDEPAIEGVVLITNPVASNQAPAMVKGDANGFETLYDPLTALPNRVLFLDRLDNALERASRYQHMIGILVISLDKITEVAGRLNGSGTDQLLAEFSQRLFQCVRQGDTAARISGNEIAILTERIDSEAGANAIADRVHESLQDSFRIGGERLQATASIGIALGSPQGQNAGNLLRDAHAAMSSARTQGGGRTIVFQQSTREHILKSLRMEGDLRGALERGEFQLHYQPEVDLTSGRIVGIETLVRWEHPKHGMIMPGEFITLAEESGLIVPIGQWILEQACRQAYRWRSRYQAAQSMVVSVNVSPMQLRHPEFVENLASTLLRERLHPSNLRIEVPGRLLAERDQVITETLQSLRELGVHLAIQDFDTSNWESSRFDHVPVDTLKIDRAFVGSQITDRTQGPSESQPIGNLEQALGLNVIVAGIETAQHVARARIFKHKSGQGFYFFRPVPVQTIDHLLSHDASPAAFGRIVQDAPLLESA